MSALERDWLMQAAGGNVQEFFAAIGISLTDRGSDETAVNCFANPAGHKRDDRDPSCSVNLLTGLWKCHGCGQSGNPYAAAIAVGYTEVRAAELARQFHLLLEVEKPRLPGERQLKKWREELRRQRKIVARLRELKGWTESALVRCGVGWDGERLTFPIRNHKLKVIGVVRYLPGGTPKSISMPGSRRGLFPAPEVLSRQKPLFVVEGEPAAVSVRSCRIQAVAVPGATGWRPEFVQRLWGFRLIVLPDSDKPGRELAERIKASLPTAQVVDLEPTLENGWDVGDLVAEAAGFGELRSLGAFFERLGEWAS